MINLDLNEMNMTSLLVLHTLMSECHDSMSLKYGSMMSLTSLLQTLMMRGEGASASTRPRSCQSCKLTLSEKRGYVNSG